MDLRVFKTQPGHRIGKFDVDAEIVRILFQLVAGRDAGRFVDREDQTRDRRSISIRQWRYAPGSVRKSSVDGAVWFIGIHLEDEVPMVNQPHLQTLKM